jgi:hypothetical protein
MATRMQQRRGTASQWISANPKLAAGEFGFEIDTNKFKIGDGTNFWNDLEYFVDSTVVFDGSEVADLVSDAVANLVGLAPNALNTLEELANAIDNDANFYSSMTTAMDNKDQAMSNALTNAYSNAISNTVGTHNEDISNVHGISNTLNLAYMSNIEDHNDATGNVHGISNTASLVYQIDFNFHVDNTSNAHGISNILNIAYKNELNDHANATANVHGISDAANLAYLEDLDNHNGDTSNVHGIANTLELATESYVVLAANAVSNALDAHNLANVNVHGISNTLNLTTFTDLSSAIDAHANVTTNVHGILDTADLALYSDVESAQSFATSAVDAHANVTANVHGITDTSKIVFMDALATTFDGDIVIDGSFTVNGGNVLVSATNINVSDPILQLAHLNAGNTVDLGVVVSYNDGDQWHSGLVKDASDGKWKLFDGVSDEPTTTVDFASGVLDDLVVNELTANGLVFSDGTQTKEGVPSRTSIISKTADYTLSALSERDSLIEVNSTDPVIITIPLNDNLAFPIGTTLDILGINTGLITIAGDTGVTVNSTPGLKLRTRWSSCTLFKRGTDAWVVYGDLKA